jgi:RNA polymerase sigma factor (sigma-70 family)
VTEVVLAEMPETEAPQRHSVELHVALMAALGTLTVRDQAVVVLRHWEDRSVEEAAGILRVSRSVVKMRDVRALGKLRDRLGEEF